MIWLIGCNGMLGSAVKELLEENTIPVVATDDVDISENDAIEAFYNDHKGISHVINCAAYTSVDKAEEEKDKAMLVNGKAPGNLANLCRGNDICLCHISTDYVFPGTGETPWDIDPPKNPVNFYGKSKLRGEENIIESGCKYAIFRTQWLYGRNGKNFVDTIKDRLLQGGDLKVVDDQIGAVTWTKDLAGVLLDAVNDELTGIYHAVNSGYASWYEVAVEIQRILGTDSKISPCSSEEYPTPAIRPYNSRLSLKSLREAGITMRDWRDALDEYLTRGGT